MHRSLPALALLALASLAACEGPATTLAPEAALFGKPTTGGGGGGGGSAMYQLQFVAYDASGAEITSDPFPAEGVALNTSDPWKDLAVSGAAWSLNNFTRGTWEQGTCSFNKSEGVRKVTWDIEETSRTFAGTWGGSISFWRNRGMNFYMEGTRTTGAGVIDNIASNHNKTAEDEDPTGNKEWFSIEFTNAGLGFGGNSDPDGTGLLSDLYGYEAACANFKIVATKMTTS